MFCDFTRLWIVCPSSSSIRIKRDIDRAANILETHYAELMEEAANLLDLLNTLDNELLGLFIQLHRIEHDLGSKGHFSRFASSFSAITFRRTFEGVESAREFVQRVRNYLGRKRFTIKHSREDIDIVRKYGVPSVGFSAYELSDMDSIVEVLNQGIADLSVGRMALTGSID